jgi:hypothetical protein
MRKPKGLSRSNLLQPKKRPRQRGTRLAGVCEHFLAVTNLGKGALTPIAAGFLR